MRTLAGRYEVGAEVGGGGTATVHRGRDQRLGREVAVKLFRVDVDAELQRSQSELQILASLNHPNLVTLFDAGEDPEAFLVMEFVDGPTLSKSLQQGPLPWEQVAILGAALASGLAHAHENGVVHRDVKPSNVLLGERGAKLTDFGVAQLENQVAVTSTGLTIGTAAYLSPEQVNGQRAGTASDVYSLGLTLLEALNGERAYPGNGVEAAIARLSRSPEIPSDLPAALKVLLREMTALEPAERPTALEVARRLELVVEGETDLETSYFQVVPTPTLEVTRVAPAPTPVQVEEPLLLAEGATAVAEEETSDRAGRRRWIALGLGALLLALVLGAAHLTREAPRTAPQDRPGEVPVPAEYEEPLDRLEELVQR